MRCARCNGCLHVEQLEWGQRPEPFCINCGARPMNLPLPLPPENRGRKSEHMKTGPHLSNPVAIGKGGAT